MYMHMQLPALGREVALVQQQAYTQLCVCYQGEHVDIGMAKFTAADGDNQLIESNVVSEYLDVQYRSSGVKLFPEDPLQLAQVSLHPGAGVISPHVLL